MKIKMVVFDMAGTVVDEDNVVYKTLQKAINEDGFDFSLEEVLAEGAGKEKLQATRDILKLSPEPQSEERAKKIHSKFVGMLAAAYDQLAIQPQPGAEEIFAELRKNGVLVVLNTGYNRTTAQSLLDKLNWKEGEAIDGLVTASDTERNRPFSDMIDFAMNRFGINAPATVVKVGDSIIDIEEGQSAHCRYSIGITTGAHTKAQLQTAKPDFIIDHLSELIEIISK